MIFKRKKQENVR